MTNHSNRSKVSARRAHSFALGKTMDCQELVKRLATLEINANPVGALFQLVDLHEAAKEIINRRLET